MPTAKNKTNFSPDIVRAYKRNKLKKERRVALFSVVVISLVVVLGFTANVFLTKAPLPKIAKGVFMNRAQIVAGQPVKWIMLIPKSQIENGKYAAQLPKGATNIKVSTVSAGRAQIILNAKPQEQISLRQRQQLALVPSKIQKNPENIFAKASTTLAADIDDAIDNLVQAIAGPTTEPSTVDLSVPAPAETLAPDLKTTTSPETTPSVIETTIPSDVPAITNENLPPLVETTTPSDYVAVEYSTPAPVITARPIENGVQVTVSATTEDPTAPLVDVLASTKIPHIFKVGQENKIKIKWKNNNNQNVFFHAYDTDADGYLDYVEWTVPHLSDQIFEIIFASNALQLDSNFNILSDIYDQVKAKDNAWASLTDGQYVRVTFAKPLTSANDNTIYARPTSLGAPATVESYPVYTDTDGNQTEGQKVATFPLIDHEDTYKVLLTNLQTPTDTFDLKIIGNIDVDYVVDPSGDPCTGQGQGTCDSGLVCNWNSVCAPVYGNAGDACTYDSDCAGDMLFGCANYGGSAICGGFSAACSYNDQTAPCASGYVCNWQGACDFSAGNPGDACSKTYWSPCKESGELRGNWASCAPDNVCGDAGAACNADTDCTSGLVCNWNSVCAPVYGNDGDACTTTDDCGYYGTGDNQIKLSCNYAHVCAGDDGNIPGESCATTPSDDCNPALGLHCNGGTCAYDNGHACTQSGECDTSCNWEGKCAAVYGNLNQECVIGNTPGSGAGGDCDWLNGLTCSRGTCRLFRYNSGCTHNTDCETDVCNWAGVCTDYYGNAGDSCAVSDLNTCNATHSLVCNFNSVCAPVYGNNGDACTVNADCLHRHCVNDICSATAGTVFVSSIAVSGAGSATSVANGSTLQMSASVSPSNATNKTITWSVTNGTGSATINSSSGLLTATGAGTITVTATATDGSNVTGTEVITVSASAATNTGGGIPYTPPAQPTAPQPPVNPTDVAQTTIDYVSQTLNEIEQFLSQNPFTPKPATPKPNQPAANPTTPTNPLQPTAPVNLNPVTVPTIVPAAPISGQAKQGFVQQAVLAVQSLIENIGDGINSILPHSKPATPPVIISVPETSPAVLQHKWNLLPANVQTNK